MTRSGSTAPLARSSDSWRDGCWRSRSRENRAFLGRAVHFLAEVGIRQFIDIGTGLPTHANVHQVAHQVAPDARVVYVDYDPIVIAHSRELLSGSDNAIVIQG